MIALLPSEIARLILNYLEEEDLTKTYEVFLDECKYLEECKLYLKRGIIVPKTIHGKTLSDYLVIDTNPFQPPKKKSTTTVSTQTETVERHSKSTECDLNFPTTNETPSLTTKRKLSASEDKSPIILAEIDQDSIGSSIENHSPKSNPIIEQQKNPISTKKRRILIGKNVEKEPELTYSTIERSVDAFIASNFSQHTEASLQTEQKSEQKNGLVYLVDSKSDNKKIDSNINLINTQSIMPSQPTQPTQIIFDLVTGQSIQNNQLFTPPQQTPLVIVPRNIDPGVSRIQAISKDPVKNIQPIVIEPFQKVHLTNALNLASQVIDTNYNTRSNRSKITNIKPKNDGKIEDSQVEIFPKKKKVYNRVTPTIRAIYEKEQQSKEENQTQQVNENGIRNEESESKDVHDEIGDIFDLPYTKSNQKLDKSDSSEINLDDICIRTNKSPNQDVKNKKNNNSNKIKKILSNKSMNSDEELDMLFSENKPLINNACPKNNTSLATNTGQISSESKSVKSSTRLLRSRTNSQRKNF
ncbi:unnamed protein product [Brachionus calyciflorus]|uniref:F-box domain-containing protein n=1 Tax=Brachionus calyciflorus TaxID=104777 RepID=A0A813UB17_9BILA|nr:unnamed protein product [Brachionus calyciflorus]